MNGQGSGQGGMGRGQGGMGRKGQCGGQGMGQGRGAGCGQAGSGTGGMGPGAMGAGRGQGRAARFQAEPGAAAPAREAFPDEGMAQDADTAPEYIAPEGQEPLARPGRCRRGMRAGLCRNQG
ncbi:hypothetical protein NNJEOMEG_02307 [Fundidesulfovibrio magnetotacticus]|uniref:Uncharacterized protein n=1 Tax=Fundidesulfovibrio magnetotacticus TaxID=2730080 RepID=A0A6V8LPI2_9BACT|nr:hypothetical protein [Fundidesulfovibrio magnetotacticus]GFK94462.1 hypothetical protein NNJEOMEG_02307 [Fundidesulfovibrio magnetotacticus]